MTTQFKIEKNIPVAARSRSVKSVWKKLAEEMEVGDSVLVNGRVEAMALRSVIVHSGFRAVTRGNDSNKTRVWKLAK